MILGKPREGRPVWRDVEAPGRHGCLWASTRLPGSHRQEREGGSPPVASCVSWVPSGRALQRPRPVVLARSRPRSEVEKPDRQHESPEPACGLSCGNWVCWSGGPGPRHPSLCPQLLLQAGLPPAGRPGGGSHGAGPLTCLSPRLCSCSRGFRLSITALTKVWGQHRNVSPVIRPGEARPAGVPRCLSQLVPGVSPLT